MKSNVIIKIVFLAAILVLFSFSGILFADESKTGEAKEIAPAPDEAETAQSQTREPETYEPVTYELDAIVVTAGKRREMISDIPKHVTVITSEDIMESTGKNIIDVLAQEAGINVRSTFGNDKQAVIDIRGMGDTAASNVLVMVDGLVLNAPDQSGPSISSVPIEQIERIEIVRGAGSVVYGSGAVGGVINIITKKTGTAPTAQVYSSYGSYKAFDNRVSLSKSMEPGTGRNDIFLNLNAGVHDSDGYRDNGFFRKKDINAKAGYAFFDRFSFNVFGSYYEDEYGLPGPVSKKDIDSKSRRNGTDRPHDNGETSETKARFELDMDFEKWGALNLKRGYLVRDNRYIIGFNPMIPRNSQKNKIDEDTRQFDLNYIKNYTAGGLLQVFQLGIDHYKTEYYREERPDGPRKNSETESAGIFINNQWSITEALMISAGARYNNYQGRFRTDKKKLFDDAKLWVNGNATKSEWDNSAYSIGVTYLVLPSTSLFANYATSFRIPNVDELAQSEESLKPQKGGHSEIGGRQRFGDFLSCTISLFDSRIEDEIYYNDINRNYDDKTIRQGIETDFTLYPSEDIRLWGSYTFTKAEFDKQGTTIPLVPEHRASAGINWKIIPQLALALSGTYIGSQFDGNDTENDRYEKLDPAFVFDGKLSYGYKSLTLFTGVNNIFNELYSTSAYSEQYYPMPERTIYGGIRWTCF